MARMGRDPHGSVDSTAREKNTTYPTDAKLHRKIIDKCVKRAKKEGIALRRSYKRTSRQPLRDTYNGTHPKHLKKADAAKRKPRTIAGRLARELERRLATGDFAREPELFKRYRPGKKTARTRSIVCTGRKSSVWARARPLWCRRKRPGSTWDHGL